MRRSLLLILLAVASVAGAQKAPLFVLQGYGDSYVAGSGAATPTIGGGFAQLSRTIPSVPAANFGVTGANSDAINLVVWTKVQPSPQVPSAYILDGGANDGPTCGTSNGCLANFQQELSASIARLTIPNQERTFASTCTQTSGTWTADTALYVIPAPTYHLNPGTAMQASGTGSVLTCTVTSRAPSSKVGLNYQITNAQTGTFTVTVDGMSANYDMCSGTTTFTSAPCGGLTLPTGGQTTTMFRQEFTGLLGTTHTVVITTTNAAKVDVTAVDALTQHPQPNSNYVVVFGPNAAFANSALYDAAIGSVAKQFAAEGARVVFADLQSPNSPGPGVNNTTDIAQTATASCTASANANHPNDVCGYYHLTQTLVNATTAAGWDIFGMPQGLGGGSTFSMTGVLLPTSAIAAGTCSLIPGSQWAVAGVTHLTKVANGWSGDPGGVDGVLTIVTAPTDAGTVVGRVCNPTAASITPTTQAINWWITP